ncbi:Type I restriction-modification system methyltransferase subunit, partial [Metamycoplasma alkalescens]
MDKKITKQQLATKIWEAANNLRRNLEAHEYKDYILSLILYKYLSDKQTELLFEGGIDKDDLKYFDNQLDLNSIDFEKTKSLQNKEEIESIKKNFIDQNGYFIQYRNLFNTW